jgi:hypothetical protein
MTLDDLLAHEEIRQTIYRHFRAVDRLDADLERSAFWDDGHFEGGPFDGPAGENMPKLFAETLETVFSTTMHCMMNMLIDLQGDHAFVEVYAAPYHVVPPEALEAVFGLAKLAELDTTRAYELVMGVRYSVRMEQRAGVWKIGVMKFIVDWSRVTPFSGLNDGGVMDSLRLRGTRDSNDPSYPWHC